jgi:hypothetical protein
LVRALERSLASLCSHPGFPLSGHSLAMGFAPLDTWKYRLSVVGIGVGLDQAGNQFGMLYKLCLLRCLAIRALGTVTVHACAVGPGSLGGHGRRSAGESSMFAVGN